jgi:hypothetical protein
VPTCDIAMETPRVPANNPPTHRVGSARRKDPGEFRIAQSSFKPTVILTAH